MILLKVDKPTLHFLQNPVFVNLFSLIYVLIISIFIKFIITTPSFYQLVKTLYHYRLVKVKHFITVWYKIIVR